MPEICQVMPAVGLGNPALSVHLDTWATHCAAALARLGLPRELVVLRRCWLRQTARLPQAASRTDAARSVAIRTRLPVPHTAGNGILPLRAGM